MAAGQTGNDPGHDAQQKLQYTEDTLRETEQRYEHLVRSVPVGIYTVQFHADGSMKFTYVSPRFCDLLDLKSEAVLRDSRLAFSGAHPDDMEGLIRVNETARTTMNPFRWEGRFIVRGETRWMRVSSNPISVPEGGSVWNGVVADITERILVEEEVRRLNQDLEKRVTERTAQLEAVNKELEAEVQRRAAAQAALQEQEELFRAITIQNPDHVLVQDSELRYTFVMNPQLGLTEEDMLGKTDYDFLSPDDADKLTAFKRQILSTGKSEHIETSLVSKEGQLEYFDGTYTPKRNAQGLVDGFIGYFRNVTELKRNEKEVQRLNEELQQRARSLETANKELESFSYSVSHDLRAPLRAIDGFSHILSEDYHDKLDQKGLHHLEAIRSNAVRMGKLIDDLLAFSRTSRGDLAVVEVNLAALARDAFEEVGAAAPGRNIVLHVGELPPAKGDRSMLRQVLVNLMSNAVKFTAERNPAVVEVDAVVLAGETVYRVKDNGAGFDMQYADKLFGVFQRLHRSDEFEGTGIGLAIVQRIVERHGGRVWAEGKPDAGAAVYFTLPAASPEST